VIRVDVNTFAIFAVFSIWWFDSHLSKMMGEDEVVGWANATLDYVGVEARTQISFLKLSIM